jgi:dTDP-4-dehydrorhamnose 3,5-epimerase
MNVIETKINGLLILEPRVFEDERGWFMESFNQKTFNRALESQGFVAPEFVQDNHSLSHRGVLRGLHYQLNPHAQGKLVRVVQGKAWDVAVDIRQDSSTFGEWVGVELSAEDKRMFWIPAGFAHGFMALEDQTQFMYKTTDYYAKDAEQSLLWSDPALAIDWPIADNMPIIVNDKDQQSLTLTQAIAAQFVF